MQNVIEKIKKIKLKIMKNENKKKKERKNEILTEQENGEGMCTRCSTENVN